MVGVIERGGSQVDLLWWPRSGSSHLEATEVHCSGAQCRSGSVITRGTRWEVLGEVYHRCPSVAWLEYTSKSSGIGRFDYNRRSLSEAVMFGWRKDAAKISVRCPLFHVRYIGCTETFVASGKGCSYAPVQRLWDNSPGERHLRRVTVQLSQTGISLRDTEKNDEVITDFRIEDISFCNTDTLVNERIFSWICRDRDNSCLQCHAVLCSTKQKAQTMALVLSRAFQMAYRDWKANKRHREVSRKPPAGGQSWTRKDHVDAQNENKVLSPGTSPLHSGTSTTNSGFDNDTTSLGDDEPSASSGFENSSILDPEVEAALADVADINDAFDEARSDVE